MSEKKHYDIEDFEVWRDPRWPPWTQDRRIWDHLRKNYGVGFGGWWDDGGADGNAPPLLTLIKGSPERVKGGR